MADHILDKGLLATGATAYSLGLVCKYADTTGKTAVQATSNAAGVLYFVCYEDLDTVRLATAKAVINFRILGVARVQAGAAFNAGVPLVVDGTSRAIAATRAGAGAQPTPTFAVSMWPASAAGVLVDVLLTPGATF